jgi:hypothetical protein
MKYLILVFVLISFVACSKRDDTYGIMNSPSFPAELEFNPHNPRYVGDLYLAPRKDMPPPEFIYEKTPIHTFDEAFQYSFQMLSRYYTPRLIQTQVPFHINFKGGTWVVSGSLPVRDANGHEIIGGVAEIAFLMEDGTILYITHSL